MRRMKRILIESDHFLKIVPVILDPETSAEHARAVADFFAHDLDFPAWCRTFRAEIAELYPARVEFAETQADFDAKLEEADAAVVESFAVTRDAISRAKRLVAGQKFGGVPAGMGTGARGGKGVGGVTSRRVGQRAHA